jgi:hypothetical protein
MLEEKKSTTESASSSTFSPKEFDASTEIAAFWDKPTNVLNQILDVIGTAIGPESFGKAIADLDQKSAALIQTLGVGNKRGQELTLTIADTIPKYLELGLKADDAAADYVKLIDTFNTNMTLTDETLVNLAATAKVTRMEGSAMAKSFQDAGTPISMVGDKMMDVAKVANQAGVTVAAVSGGVVKNLDKMSLYNFDNGIKGLAKMAAQASRLGIDMEKVFAVTEKVFNPEGAIELSASLQRLGVASSELLDPLRLMDLAQNDPTELQNQIVNMTKDFTRFNEQTKSFEILPGAKRRMREVADALGMTGTEFSKMALNAANFDMKLKQIKFSPDVKEEDRELVATMAQFNKGGVAEVKIREMKTNEKGEQEWTGEYITKAVSELKDDDVKNLKDLQELQGKSMEEIAFDQLSQLVALNGSFNKLSTSLTYGAASNKNVQKTFKSGMSSATKSITSVNDEFDTPDVRQRLDLVLKNIGSMFEKLPNLGTMFEGATTKLTELVTKISTLITNNNGSISVNDFEIRTLPQDKLVMAGGTNIDGSKNSNTSSNTGLNEVNMTHTFNFSNLPSYVTSTEVERILKEYTQNSQNALAMVKASGNVNNGLTSKK